MTKENIIFALNEDLKNEYKHMLFYLHSAIRAKSIHILELKEFLLEKASSEMKHIQEFGDIIVGLGGIPTKSCNDFPSLDDPAEIIKYALEMEQEVVANYVQRKKDAANLGGIDGTFIELFLEDQIMDSRKDADFLKQLTKI